MASGRVTRRFLFRTSFLSFVHLWGQSRSLREVTDEVWGEATDEVWGEGGKLPVLEMGSRAAQPVKTAAGLNRPRTAGEAEAAERESPHS